MMPIAKTRNGITQRIEENRRLHKNISASAVEHDINGKIHAIIASKIYKKKIIINYFSIKKKKNNITFGMLC